MSVFEQMFSLEKKYIKHDALLEGLTGAKEAFALCCSHALKFSDKFACCQPGFGVGQRTLKEEMYSTYIQFSLYSFSVRAYMEIKV